jgi:hypothetical protein
MRIPHIRLAALALLSGVALSGCAYGLDGAYGGVNVGYGSYGSAYGYGGGYGYDPYYGGYGSYAGYGGYNGYGYGGFGDPFGWYGNYYYPGTGFYIYDRHRHRHRLTDEQQRFWRNMFARSRTAGTTAATSRSVAPRENWSGFNRSRGQTTTSTTTAPDNRNRGRWQNRSSATTSSDSDTTTRTRPDWRGHGHNRPNDQ